jgi:hypothetical protein
MPTAEASVTTDRASRYLVQLCGHAEQMRRMRHRPSKGHGDRPGVGHVDYSDTAGTVRFDDGLLVLRASADALTLRIEAGDEDGLRRLQDGIAGRLRTIGRRDRLTLTWHEVETAAAPTEAPELVHRKRWWRSSFGLLAVLGAIALIVALHLGLGSDVLLVTSLATVVFIGVHVLAARFAYRGGKAAHKRWKARRA